MFANARICGQGPVVTGGPLTTGNLINLADGAQDTDYDARMTINVTAVPEPSSAALLGLGGLALIVRRRK